MKLYTEEQVRKAIKLADECRDVDTSVENGIISVLTPIELPSDEEVEEIGKDVIIYNDTKRGWFIAGLKFMRDKIQGDNK